MPYIPTPWRTPSDLIEVRTLLFGSPTDPATPTSQREACARIHAWSLRRAGMPHAVESTALLVDALLLSAPSPFHPPFTLPSKDPRMDVFQTNDTLRDTNRSPSPPSPSLPSTALPSLSPFAQTSTLTAAFTHTITGLADMAQTSLHKRRMADATADAYGMPAHFISFRHELTHGSRVSVRRLRRMCEEAVEWLRVVYWAKLPDARDDGKKVIEVGEGEVREGVRSVLVRFRKRRVAELRDTQRVEGVSEAVREAGGAVVELCARLGMKNVTRGLMKGLVSEGMLIPKGHRAGGSMKGAFVMWDQLLRVLSGALDGFGEALLRRMTSFVCEEADDGDEGSVDAVVEWIVHLFADGDWCLSGVLGDREYLEEEVRRACEGFIGLSGAAERVCDKLLGLHEG